MVLVAAAHLEPALPVESLVYISSIYCPPCLRAALHPVCDWSLARLCGTAGASRRLQLNKPPSPREAQLPHLKEQELLRSDGVGLMHR